MFRIKEEEKRPINKSSDINLKVSRQDGTHILYTIKRSDQLRTLMNDYCDRVFKRQGYYTFCFDGARIRGEQTPDELKMEDDDEIDAFEPQIGGAFEPQIGGSFDGL